MSPIPTDGTPLFFQDVQSNLCLSLLGEQVYLRPLAEATQFRLTLQMNDNNNNEYFSFGIQGSTGRYLGQTSFENIVASSPTCLGWEHFRLVDCSTETETLVAFLLVQSKSGDGKYLGVETNSTLITLTDNLNYALRFRYTSECQAIIKAVQYAAQQA